MPEKQVQQKIVEWNSDSLEPSKTMWVDGEEVYGSSVKVQCPEAGEIAVYLDYNGRGDAAEGGAAASLYLTPSEACLLAERIRTAAWIAEKLEVDDAV